MINYNDKKVYIDKDLWYIEDFITDEEHAFFMEMANDPLGWYKTMRSPSIRNKFLDKKVLDVNEDGSLKRIPVDSDETLEIAILLRESDLIQRFISVLPPTFAGCSAFQSFWPLSEKEVSEIDSPGIQMGAYAYHYEDHEDMPGDMTAAWSLYLNDNFNGGILEFKNKPYKLYPKPKMLVSVPLTKDFEHRVTPVTEGIRHTIYGSCHKDINDRPVSTVENC